MMKFKYILGALALILALSAMGWLYGLRLQAGEHPEPTPTPAPTAEPTPTPAPSPSPTPEPTPSPTPEPTPEPARTYRFSFAGDCTIGTLLEWQTGQTGSFPDTVGDNYAYPLSGVKDIFAADDFTMVNLEGVLTTSADAVNKKYRFEGNPAYAQVLSEGSVEAVSMANNHAGDFQDAGRADTRAALDAVGIQYAAAGAPLITVLDGGLRVGVVAYNTVENTEGLDVWRAAIQADIDACMAADCQLIIGFMHWGSVEYLTEPEDWEVQLAHDMADWGCDMIVGGHAHILQRMETYNGVPIFYSMGNFCYGGNLNPDDKDSVIVQAAFTFDPAAGAVALSDLGVVPCRISSTADRNDYCPTPYAEDSADYQRVLEKLEWSA